MSDIDFLANKKSDDDQKLKRKEDKKEELIWSKPEKDKPAPQGTAFSFLPFLGNKRAPPAPAPESAINKNKIKQSRQEILKLIKDRENSEAEETKPARKNLLAILGGQFKKPPSPKEILIDYQQVFNQERIKRSQISQAFNFRSESDNKTAVKREKIVGPSWLSKLFKLIKEKLSALRVPAIETAKINLAEKLKEIKPEIVEAPKREPELVIEAKKKIKIEEKILKPEAPAPIEEDIPKVLETNLIKGEIITFFDWHKKITVFVGVVLTSVGLVLAIYFGLMYYQKQNQAKIQNQAKKFNELIDEIKKEEIGLKEITDFQARLKMVSQIFSKHIYWTNFFKFLEDNTIKDVYYTGFAGDTSGNYALDSLASTFTNISEQVDIMKTNNKITKAWVIGGETVAGDYEDESKVKFILNFSILKSIFTE